MNLYYSMEKTGGWMPALAAQRKQITEEVKPKYITVLDVSDLVEDGAEAEKLLALRYRGPFYADWDCDQISDGVDSVNRFLEDLEGLGVNLRCVSIYATGGRGFHVEVPFQVFSSSKSNDLLYLPAIYLEIANRLYTADMDLKVYSAKRGRMWRTPNVEREQPGRYKVPLTLTQMRNMTQGMYDKLCSSPQPWPELDEPKLSPTLAAYFIDAKKKIDQVYRERKNKPRDSEAVKRMNGDWPESVKKLMNGENVSPNVGLNKIALQLGILSAALGKSEAQHIDACEGLIREYRGDGHTTIVAVRKELKRMYRYAAENVCYSYSPAAISACMENKVGVGDLSGRAGPTGTGEEARSFNDLTGGIVNGTNGLYSNHSERGLRRESNWHFDSESVQEIIDASSLEAKGYTLIGKREGQSAGEVNLDQHSFVSAEKAKSFLASKGGVAPHMDSAKAGNIMALIMDSSRANGQVHVIDKEGIVLVERPGEEPEIVWSSPAGCMAHNAKYTYRFRSISGAESGNFRSDVALANPISDFDVKLVDKTLEALLTFNENLTTVGLVLGWFMACWHKPMYLKWGEQFPILQLHGESGAGKTALAQQLLHLFFFRNKPRMLNAVGGSAYGRRQMYLSSSTIPLLVDEFKPHQMGAEQARQFRMDIHRMYTPQMQAPRGGGDARSNNPGQWAELVSETMTTPMLFTTEHPETEPAIQERTISAAFTKAARRTDEAVGAFKTLRDNREILASIGRLMLNATAAAPLDRLKAVFDRSQAVAAEKLAKDGNDRIVYNVGCAVSGLTFFEMVLKHALPQLYESKYQEDFTILRDTILDPKHLIDTVAEPEIVKLIRMLVLLSHQEDEESDLVCKETIDFCYTRSGDLDLNVDAAYMRYRTLTQRRGLTIKFPDPDSFLISLRNSNLCIDDSPADSPFNEAAYAVRAVRLDVDMLANFNVGRFKTKGR